MTKLGRVVLSAAAVLAAFAASAAGCSPSSDEANGSNPTPTSGSGGATTTSGNGGTGQGGSSGCQPVPGFDPVAKGLPSCCDKTPSHCVAKTDVPAAIADGLAACKSTGDADGLCVPDSMTTKGSDFKAATCTALGKEGRCFSLCIEKIAKDPNVGLLSQDKCESGEVCVPCINPLTSQPTGACEMPPICAGGAGGSGSGGSGAGGSAPTCPHEGPPVVDPTTFGPCGPACAAAHCLPAALVPDEQQGLLAVCPDKNGGQGYCVPDKAIASGGNFIPKTCTSLAKAEGRCLSQCLPMVSDEAAILPRDVCDKDEYCVPCTDPTTGKDTGACTQSCDPGPTKKPVVLTCPYDGPPVIDPKKFPACKPACGGAHCIPDAFVPDAQKDLLASCPGGYCLPDDLTAGAGFAVPDTCKSTAGAEGRCVSTCLPQIAAQKDMLPQSTCAANERCAPCFNPTGVNPKLSTGACDTACDKPKEAPLVLTCPWKGPPVVDPSKLPACAPACGGAHCVPFYAVPAAQQASLSVCPGGYCVPDTVSSTGGNFVPKTCAPLPGFPDAEGRCISSCLKSVADQAASLVQDACDAGELCVPCTDPVTGKDTGACNTAPCDAPAKPAYAFPKCCDYLGSPQATCLPTAKIPADQAKGLQQATCPADFLCVPDEYIPQQGVPIATCTTPGGGACVSKCVPNLPGYLGSGDCPDKNHVCVPCQFAPTTPGCK